ncbi:MAG TPA: sigma-54 dependent transcriptional regulator [Polyangiaceae bacterium]|nr:sigma-54 dependent transcriptional regulator [Polyangiaceae bacterium]
MVDDDASLAKALQRVLGHQGFTVDVALDGKSALDRLSVCTYDVMLLDLRMAQMDGLEVFRWARESSSPPATILHSAYVDVRTAVSAIRSGMRDVMEKPVPEQTLTQRIRELAAERRRLLSRGKAPSSSRPPAVLRLVGDSAVMSVLRDHIERVAADRDRSVLVQGATGTGKELVAEALHALTSPEEPFVSVNCAAVPEHLFEGELFGREGGSNGGQPGTHAGLLEEAGGGTLFLDEVGEVPESVQGKLLRALETRQFRRVGSDVDRPFAARVVSATSRALDGESGSAMRSDLHARLAGRTIFTPRLVEHLEDLPQLARHFASEFATRHGVARPTLTEEALDLLLVSYDWPGNVRELRAVIENACILAGTGVIGRTEVLRALEPRSGQRADKSSESGSVGNEGSGLRRAMWKDEAAPSSGLVGFGSLPDLQRNLILKAFEESNRNLSLAARELGIPRSTLRDRLRKYGVR